MGFSIVPLLDAFFRHAFSAAGLRPATLTLPSTNATLHYWAPPGPVQKPPLLLIHGFGPSATWQWRHQVGPLSLRFHVIVPDLLFFGDSCTTHPSPGPLSEAEQAKALAALLENLVGESRSRVAVVGTSYGGFVAYHLAKLVGPERVGPVVIASSDLLKGPADDRAFLKRAGVEDPNRGSVIDLMLPTEAEDLRKLVGLAFYRPPPIVPQFVLRDVIKNLYMDKREEKIELIKAITIGTDAFQLTPLPQDVLIIWGDYDQIFPVEKAFAVKRCLGERAKLEILKNTSHMPQIEDSNRFNKILLNFLLDSSKSASV